MKVAAWQVLGASTEVSGILCDAKIKCQTCREMFENAPSVVGGGGGGSSGSGTPRDHLMTLWFLA